MMLLRMLWCSVQASLQGTSCPTGSLCTAVAVGISLTSTHGCSVYVLDQGSRAVNVYEGLSDDCVWGVIAAAGGLGAVHLHRPLDMPRPVRGLR